MLIVGIDPGKVTGLAAWDATAQAFRSVESFVLHKALAEVEIRLRRCRMQGEPDPLVICEDARQRRSFGRMDVLQEKYGAAVREGAGAAKRDAKIWDDYLRELGIPYLMRKPAATKYDAPTFARMARWPARTNEHQRDAGMIVLGINAAMASGLWRDWEQRKLEAEKGRKRKRK